MGRDLEKPLWRCPTCNQEFVTRNMPHSCQVRSIDEHFAGTDPAREVAEAIARGEDPSTVR